ncbi:hypothetical protein SteCoe_19118 [Stentor coeruleus]|uniref:Uncharacterized protein n=1 Tax=Stentor coeruleus TaxID=5963 RepID=A0A1R2BV93_9CILI|nr:hypothetical protein SteCoe_19118 [Stentor coeruleus]
MSSDKVIPGSNDAPSHMKPPSFFHKRSIKFYKPIPTIKSAAIIFSVLGVIFIIVGAVLLAYSLKTIEYKARYDNKDECQHTTWDKNRTCEVEFEIDKKMEKPVLFYYQLNNFYQNHRRYVKSKSAQQLKYANMSKEEVSNDCDPIITMKDLGRAQEDLLPGVREYYESDDKVALPCGLIAKTFFNDTYEIFHGDLKITIDETDIAWPSDKKNIKSVDDEAANYWTNVSDEHFIVWMRTSGLPNFRKLWGRIYEDLEGKYTVRILSKYDVTDFNGEKYVVISTANALGGDNTFLGIAYIVVGGVVLIVALAFVIRGYFFKKPDNQHFN